MCDSDEVVNVVNAEDWITVEEAAGIIGVSKTQVSRYCVSGMLASEAISPRGRGHVRRIKREDALRFQRPRRGPKGDKS